MSTDEERAREVLSKHGIEILGATMAWRGNVLTGHAIVAAMLEFAAEQRWQDIASAPKDGTQLDLWSVYDNGGTKTGERLTFCRWRNESVTYDQGWHDCFGNKIEWSGDGGCSRVVTHFQLLPPPPTGVQP